jgi:hypothetical protein
MIKIRVQCNAVIYWKKTKKAPAGVDVPAGFFRSLIRETLSTAFTIMLLP